MLRTAMLLVCLASACLATSYVDCGSKAGGLSFEVEGCKTSPCQVHRGDSFRVNIAFTPDHDIDDLQAEIDGIISGVTIPWPGFDKNGCSYIDGGKCPLKAGESVTWSYPCYVEPSYPQIDVLAVFKLFGKAGDPNHMEICMKSPVVII